MYEKDLASTNQVVVGVYGTLKKGHALHSYLEGQEYLGEDLVPGYRMYSLGAFPAVMATGDPKDKVRVEFYEVDQDTLDQLDRVEGHPNFYTRELISRESLGIEGGEFYMYVQYDLKDRFQVSSGTW